MDAKDLRTEPALSDRDNEGSKYAQSGGVALQCDRNKTYQDIGSNSLSKVEVQSVRPCAVIGPDRIVPQAVANESYLKKGPSESWPSRDVYRYPPEYPRKLSDYQSPTRNISPRQTFQENMQRIMVAPTYNTLKINDDNNYAQMPDRNIALSKNIKLNMPPEAKYCDVPYTINPINNEQKNVRVSDICVSSVNPSLTRTAPHCWSPATVNSRPPRPYGAPELYQYHDYPSCAGPRPLVHRTHRIHPEEPGYMFTDPHYTDGNIRFKPYPTIKDRYQPARYDYIGNYANPFHPPPSFPSHKYDFQKSMPHPFPPYTPVKYLDNRAIDPILDQRNPQGNYNMQYHNQVIHSNYGAVIGNCSQNKMHPYPTDSSLKVIPPNKLSHDNSNKVYVEYDNSRPKMYPPSESYFVNERGRMPLNKSQVLMHNYPNINMPPGNSYYKKDNAQMKNYEYMTHFRSMDPTINIHSPMIRHPPLFSPNTLAIFPSDSFTSNDTSQTLGTLQEDCGYVSQSSSISSRSMDSSINRLPNDYYKRYYDSKYGHLIRTSSMIPKNEMHLNSCKEKKNINVRQFLQMWNEGDDETEENNSKENTNDIDSTDANILSKTHNVANNNEQLYVLGLVNVPSEELDKYEHIQKITKLPENIKGYTNIELLNQFEEVIESSNINNFKSHTPKDNFPMSLKETLPKQGLGILPRPVSPLDVEAKISQSVIHKDVGCNFEIKPCSPKMLNVEIAAPVQNILAERVIEKVTNPVSIKSPLLNNIQDNIDYNLMNRQDHRLHMNEGRIASCKMFNTQFSDINPLDPIKSIYSYQELESNSGLCLASLPRLDNDIELNFPEVNQQFINANKGDPVDSIPSLKDLPTLGVLDHSDYENNNNEVTVLSQKTKITSTSESDKEFSKLSKYRKNKITEDYKLKSQSKDEDNFENNKNAIRTDSVIIKNPENVKKYDDNSGFSTHCLSKLEHPVINLPPHLNLENNEKEAINGCVVSKQENQPLALDFSVNRNNESNFKSDLEMSKENDNSVFQIIDKHFNENSENYLYNVPILTPKGSQNNIENVNDDCNSIDKQSDNLENTAQNNDQNIDLNHHNNLQKKELHIKSEVVKRENEAPSECYLNSDCALKSKSQHNTENIINASDNFKPTEKCSDDFNSVEKCSDNLETFSHNNDCKIDLNGQNNSQNKSNMCKNQELDIKSDVMEHVNQKPSEHDLNSDYSMDFCSQHNTKKIIEVSDNFNSVCSDNLETFPQNKDYKVDVNPNNNLQNNSNTCENKELDIKSEVIEQVNEVSPKCYLKPDCSLKFNSQCNTENFIDVSNHFNSVEKSDDDLETLTKNSDDEIDLNYNNNEENKSNICINQELDVKNGAVKILSMINDTSDKNTIKDECNNEGPLNSLTGKTKNNQTIEGITIEFQKEDITEIDKVQIISNSENLQNDFNEPITKEAMNITTLNKENVNNSVLYHSPESGRQTVIPDDLKETGSHESPNSEILNSDQHALEEEVTSHIHPSNEYDVLALESKEDKINKCNDSNNTQCMGNEHSFTLNEQSKPYELERYLYLWSKEMFSPWMQKLITFNEGYVVMQTDGNNKGLEKPSTEHLRSMCDNRKTDNTLLNNTQVLESINATSGTYVTNLYDSQDEIKSKPHQVQPDNIFVDTYNILNNKVESKDDHNEISLKIPITNSKLTLRDETTNLETTETFHKTFSKQNHVVSNIKKPKQFRFEDNKAVIYENSVLSSKDDGNNNLSQCTELGLLNQQEIEQTNTSFQEVLTDTGVLGESEKIEEGIISSAQTKLCSIMQSIHNGNLCKRRQPIKRSLSDSALNVYDIDINVCRENDEDIRLVWPLKRRKMNRIESLNSDLLTQNLCNIFQNHRRNSISTTYNEDDVSFCILIDNSCITDQENEEQKICFTELSEECVEIEHSKNDEAGENIEILAPASAEINVPCEYSDSFLIECEENNTLGNPWVEDIACMETVISDDVEEDVIISGLSSPKDAYVSDNNESDIFSSNEHTDKVKYIYGNKMCKDDAQYLETLYKTPQMDVNKTLNIRESRVIEKCDKYYDNDSLEKVLSESNCNTSDLMNSIITVGVSNSSNTPDDKENKNIEIFSLPQSDSSSRNVEENVELSYVEQENCQPIHQFIKTQDDTVDSCESSIDNVFSYKHEPKEENMNCITSSSPEVSSTTSEEQNSNIFLKITNIKGSRLTQINNIVNNRPRCKFTEENDYLHPHLSFSKNRPLLTKAAQKYIPPLKESIQDLKVKLHLPHHSLMKLKQLKISKDEPKPKIQNNVPRIQKKTKPKFEDVLMSIDEIQFQKHKEKSKKVKKSIPKVVIKKSQNGSHYASTSIKNEFNPDLTGRKWQPWVFLEKNPFIDKMVIRKKNKAIYSHRKKTYVLEEKFKKYKCVNNAKFVISQPKTDNQSTGLKYTIRLKHGC